MVKVVWLMSLWLLIDLASGQVVIGDPIKLSLKQWRQIFSDITYPNKHLRNRRWGASAFRGSKEISAWVQSDYYEQTGEYRRYFESTCWKKIQGWRCDAPRDMAEIAGSERVVALVAPISGRELMKVARFVATFEPAWMSDNDVQQPAHLSSVKKMSELYEVNVYGRDPYCWWTLRLRNTASGELEAEVPRSRTCV